MFCTHTGHSLSHDAVERLVTKHAGAAAATCPSLQANLDRHPNYILAAYMSAGT